MELDEILEKYLILFMHTVSPLSPQEVKGGYLRETVIQAHKDILNWIKEKAPVEDSLTTWDTSKLPMEEIHPFDFFKGRNAYRTELFRRLDEKPKRRKM